MTDNPDVRKSNASSEDEAIAAETIVTFTALWAAEQDEAAIAFIADDAIYRLHLGDTPLDYRGEAVGKDAVVARLRRFREDWEYILWRPGPWTVEGSIVRQQAEYIHRWRKTGEDITGRSRFVWTVRNGLVARCDEYHDGAMFEAFMRLYALPPPELRAGNRAGLT